ncbi:hypothetical protein BDF14DRAFT_1886824 [Spinellus fusiger]|nr:hypothetical protein BDF14DRAFT_1886824 [Spinellus fusiger]
MPMNMCESLSQPINIYTPDSLIIPDSFSSSFHDNSTLTDYGEDYSFNNDMISMNDVFFEDIGDIASTGESYYDSFLQFALEEETATIGMVKQFPNNYDYSVSYPTQPTFSSIIQESSLPTFSSMDLLSTTSSPFLCSPATKYESTSNYSYLSSDSPSLMEEMPDTPHLSQKSTANIQEMRHKCPFCLHKSNRANNMKEHILTHDPCRPKNFVCSYCERAFARKHDLKRHIKSHQRHQTVDQKRG